MEKTKTLYRSKFIKFNSKPTQMTGVFAIAFMTEFCFSGWNGKNSVHFDTNVMRNHLLKCMEDKQFSPLNLKNTSVNLSIKRNARPSVICRIYLKTWFLVISVPLGIILAVLQSIFRQVFPLLATTEAVFDEQYVLLDNEL